jgi:hydroxymethylglutaryl-CoA synthase
MGATYGASTFIGLIGLLDSDPDVKAGDRLGIFAYGSGSCAQFYSARVLSEAKSLAAKVGLQAQLDARRPLTVAEYETVEHERDAHVGVSHFSPTWNILGDWYERFYAGRRLLTLRGIADYYREYDWS